jgi:hypothetical protein
MEKELERWEAAKEQIRKKWTDTKQQRNKEERSGQVGGS